MFLLPLFIIVAVVILAFSIRIVQQWQKGVVFARLL